MLKESTMTFRDSDLEVTDTSRLHGSTRPVYGQKLLHWWLQPPCSLQSKSFVLHQVCTYTSGERGKDLTEWTLRVWGTARDSSGMEYCRLDMVIPFVTAFLDRCNGSSETYAKDCINSTQIFYMMFVLVVATFIGPKLSSKIWIAIYATSRALCWSTLSYIVALDVLLWSSPFQILLFRIFVCFSILSIQHASQFWNLNMYIKSQKL